jgi:hypothetical protein
MVEPREVDVVRRLHKSFFALLTLMALVAVPVAAQWITCEGPSGTYRVLESVACSEALKPQNAARGFLESKLETNASLTASGIATVLEEEATKACVQRPEKDTLGTLYGVGRWGCENGYSYRNLCQGYYLEKEVQADYGYAVVYHVVVSSSGWNVLAFDSASSTVTRMSAGDVRLSVILSLRNNSVSTVLAPAGYEAGLQRRGQASAILMEILDYCRAYKEAYCEELRSLAALLSRPGTAPAGGATPVSLSIVATANKHLSSTVPLDLSSDAVSLVAVTGVVTDDRGQPVADAEVRIAGLAATARTSPDGAYRVSSFGTGTSLVSRRVNVTLERATVDVALKTASDTGPILGIATDGVSRLTFSVSSHGIRPESVTVTPPTLGAFERASSVAAALTLDKDGNGTLVYLPPSVLPSEALTTSLEIGTGSAARTVPAAPVSISVRYIDLDGATQTTTVSIKVCRPPVLLVQSYLGGPASWSAFSEVARIRRLDCQIVGEGVTWGLGNGSLEEWAKELARSLFETRATYAASGVKIAAVDVVAHSVGGLVARSLLEGADSRQDVRRLILVGTPNHGIAWLDQEVGAAASRWLAAHPTAAAELHEGSAFLRQLSSPGAADRRTEYINVVGRRAPSLSASRQGSSTVQDDGIVSAASSHLDGVPEIRLDGVVHAPGLPLEGAGLTESSAVWAKLVDLLVGEAPQAEPDALRIELRRGGLVGTSTSIDPQPTQWTPVSKFPAALKDGVAIRTLDKGQATIAVVQAGDTWGLISLDAKTEVILRASSPSLIRIEVVSGRARFRADAADAGDFEVVLDASPRGALWYATQPDVRTLGVQGDYVVAREETSSVLALNGTIIVEYSKGVGFSPARLVEAGTGIRVRANGVIEDEAVPARGWWTSGVWRDSLPLFHFPIWVMALMLAGLGGAAVYHSREKRGLAERTRQKPVP